MPTELAKLLLLMKICYINYVLVKGIVNKNVLPVKEMSRSIIEWVGGRGTSTDMISPGAMCTIYHILWLIFHLLNFLVRTEVFLSHSRVQMLSMIMFGFKVENWHDNNNTEVCRRNRMCFSLGWDLTSFWLISLWLIMNWTKLTDGGPASPTARLLLRLESGRLR